MIGKLLADLDRRHLAQNTVIIYASDHGLLMGEYGMGGKALLYDLASKIPCFIHDPALPADRRGRRVEELVSSLDITKTILDYAGVAAPAFMTGESLRPLVLGKGRAVARRAVPGKPLHGPGYAFPGRNPFRQVEVHPDVRRQDGLYRESDVDFSNRKPDFEMLFDLDADPGEMNNLIESPNNIEILAVLRKKCAAHSEALNHQREAFIKAVHVRNR